jgi:methylglutaconyl-CoA hydratase
MSNPIADPLVEGVDSDAENPSVRIEATRAGAVTVWIDRPGKGNAFDSLTVAALHEAFETLQAAEGVRIVFIRGAGGQFSGGFDADWLRLSADLLEDDHRRDIAAQSLMLRTLSEIPALTVALVEGAAVGLAAGLVCACDLTVATKDVRLGFPAVRLGQVPAPVMAYVVEAVGPRTARALLASGRTIEAAEAQAIGLVQRLAVDAVGLEAIQAEMAREAMANAPGAVGATKALVRRLAGRAGDQGLIDEAARLAAQTRMGDEGREGVAAAVKGRAPSWTAV